MKILELIGLAPSARDRKLSELVAGSYPSVKVVGRGTVKIDPEEVRSSEEFRRARKMAAAIVRP
ncbi:hypothetical protein [Novosphingobium resinovorum]|uniref:hypothetical protein n=1 Tax=Novosphingobium resinovorum TaxID=158500 RepID=UPI002ED69959